MYQVISDPENTLVFESDDIDQAFAVAYSFAMKCVSNAIIWNNRDCIIEETICHPANIVELA